MFYLECRQKTWACSTVCCSVLQRVAACCSVLHCVALRCSVFLSSTRGANKKHMGVQRSVLQCLQCVAVCCSVCSVLLGATCGADK